MKLFLLSQTENHDWDTYDSMVVAAPDEEIARDINPYGYRPVFMDWEAEARSHLSSWATKRENVYVQYIGEAAKGIKIGVICSSFNAG